MVFPVIGFASVRLELMQRAIVNVQVLKLLNVRITFVVQLHVLMVTMWFGQQQTGVATVSASAPSPLPPPPMPLGPVATPVPIVSVSSGTPPSQGPTVTTQVR